MKKKLNFLCILAVLFGFNISNAQEFKIKNNLDLLTKELTEKISPDSIAKHILNLQNFGSRYAYADNRKAVAQWIKNEFERLNYNCILDSFEAENYNDKKFMQYNVIAFMPGIGRTEEVYLIGAHHDCITYNDPKNKAPGADDNASGVAAAIEIARVFSEANFQSQATICFTTFAAEEIGLYGANDFAKNVKLDVKMMINNDMIAHDVEPPYTVNLCEYEGAGNLKDYAVEIAKKYTSLKMTFINTYLQYSDSYEFAKNNIPSIFFIEDEFSPYYHSINDSLSRCNMDYCAEVIRLSCAMLIHAAGKFNQTETPSFSTIIYENTLNITAFIPSDSKVELSLIDKKNKVIRSPETYTSNNKYIRVDFSLNNLNKKAKILRIKILSSGKTIDHKLKNY